MSVVCPFSSTSEMSKSFARKLVILYIPYARVAKQKNYTCSRKLLDFVRGEEPYRYVTPMAGVEENEPVKLGRLLHDYVDETGELPSPVELR